jgi:hypothetical protein
MVGKGDKWRKDFDFNKYYTNMDSLSGEKPKTKAKKVIKLKNGKTRFIY